jgi:hypothetical protein
VTIVPATLDYTDLDQEALEKRIYRAVDGMYPTWSERRRASLGNTLVGLFAHMGDVVCFLQDNQAAEAFLPTATLRENILAIVRRQGYRPATASAAQATIVAVLDEVAAGDVVIPAGKRILTAEVTAPVAFQLIEDLVIPAGQVTASADAEHSETRADVFQASGNANQSILLRFAPFLDDSLVVVAANGTFTVVDDLLSSSSTDRHCTVTVDERDRATVRFGNGVSGAIPTGTMTATYKTGGGASGNVEAGRLKRLEGVYRDSFGTPVRVTVTNPAKAGGGDAREGNAAIKRNAPRAQRVLERAVAREDYEIVAESVPGVARALHVTGNQMGGIGENQGLLLIVPDGMGAPTQGLLDAVKARFEPVDGYPAPDKKKSNTYHLVYAVAPYLDIDWAAVVYLAPNVTEAQARANIEAAIDAFHALEVQDQATGELVVNDAINFGYYASGALAYSDAYNVVRDAAGVKKIDAGPTGLLLNGERDDVLLSTAQFPRKGTVTLVNGATGEPF